MAGSLSTCLWRGFKEIAQTVLWVHIGQTTITSFLESMRIVVACAGCIILVQHSLGIHTSKTMVFGQTNVSRSSKSINLNEVHICSGQISPQTLEQGLD